MGSWGALSCKIREEQLEGVEQVRREKKTV